MPHRARPTINFGIVLTGESVFGRNLSISECRALLSTLELESVLVRLALLARINDEGAMDDSLEETEKLQHVQWLLRLLLPDQRIREALAEGATAIRNGQRFRAISSQALSGLFEFAGSCCRRAGGENASIDPHRTNLSHVLLSFQSQLVPSLANRHGNLNGDPERAVAEFERDFVRNRLAHNQGWYTRNCMGRLYALGFVSAVGSTLRGGATPAQWFQEWLGLSPVEFSSAAFLVQTFGPPLQFGNTSSGTIRLVTSKAAIFANIQEAFRPSTERLLRVATRPISGLGSSIKADSTIANVIYDATDISRHPFVALDDDRLLCLSYLHLKNRFFAGLPHIARDLSRNDRGGELPDSAVKKLGGQFGELFEGYVRWLFSEWFGGWPRTKTHFGYQVPHSREGGNSPERDIVLIRGNVAFAFEIKSKQTQRTLRTTGDFTERDKLFLPPALQAHSAALALLDGTARTADGTAIRRVTHVIPIGVVWDFVPMAGAFSENYERHLEQEAQTILFTSHGGIAPMQYLSIEDLESWERLFNLAPESSTVFTALRERAKSRVSRYSRMDAFQGRSPLNGQPKPLELAASRLEELLRRDLPNRIVRPPAQSSP